MSRVSQPNGTKGSLKWIQLLINDCPQLINPLLQTECSLIADESIIWLSPLKDDEFAEYWDQYFLNRLGVDLKQRSLNTFWPNSGPHWDALGRTEKGKVFLLEAKAHVTEIVTPGTGAKSPRSKALIEKSLQEVKSFLALRSSTDWSNVLYQYANRLAHLYLLRELNNIPAFLVFVYFLNDNEMNGPTTKEEWIAAIQVVEGVLGLGEKHRLKPYIIDLFIDVNDIKTAIKGLKLEQISTNDGTSGLIDALQQKVKGKSVDVRLDI